MDALLDILKKNPRALPAELPGARDWLKELLNGGGAQFCDERPVLDDKRPFLLEALEWMSVSVACASYQVWYSDDNEYLDGPDRTCSSWYTDEHNGNGNFKGLVVDGVTDILGAILAVLNDKSFDGSVFASFTELASKEWVAPATQAVIDEVVSDSIKKEWERLSTAARGKLLAELDTKPLTIEFVGVPEENVAVYGEAVIDTLGKLGLGFEYDETFPPDVAGDTTYRVVGVSRLSE
jgi:hypothetical protein